MDKIKLKNGIEIEIEESSNGGSFRKAFSNPVDYLTTLAQLTEDNLSAYQVLNSGGNVTGNPENKECLTQTVTPIRGEDGALIGLDVTFNISDVDMLAKAVRDLQAGQQVLTEGQEVQDEAITELADIMGGEA